MEEFELSAASKKTKTIYISTVISITLVLLLAGLLGLILVHAQRLSSHVKENMVLNVMMSDMVKEEDVFALQHQIDRKSVV